MSWSCIAGLVGTAEEVVAAVEAELAAAADELADLERRVVEEAALPPAPVGVLLQCPVLLWRRSGPPVARHERERIVMLLDKVQAASGHSAARCLPVPGGTAL